MIQLEGHSTYFISWSDDIQIQLRIWRFEVFMQAKLLLVNSFFENKQLFALYQLLMQSQQLSEDESSKLIWLLRLRTSMLGELLVTPNLSIKKWIVALSPATVKLFRMEKISGKHGSKGINYRDDPCSSSKAEVLSDFLKKSGTC